MAYPDLDESNQALRDRFARNPVQPNYPQRDQSRLVSGGIGGQGPSGPGPDLDTSNQVQRDRYASRPVVPNGPAPTEPYADVDGTIVDPGASVSGVIRGAASAAGNAISNGLGVVNAVLRPDSTSAQSFVARNGEQSGPISSASAAPAPARPQAPASAPAAAPASDPYGPSSGWATDQGGASSQSVPVPREPIITQAALTPRAGPARDTIADANQVNRPELNVIRAREAQAAQDGNNQMRADARVAQAGYDLTKAQNEARFDKFRAQNAADVVLGGNGRTRRTYADAAANSAAALAAAQGAVTAANTAANPTRNYVQDAVAQNQAATGGQAALEAAKTGQVDREGKLITGSIEQQKLAQSKQLTDLTNVLATSADPAARQRASDAILAMHGKDTSGRYRVVHAAGGTGVAADGFTPVKYPDRVVIHDTQTGKYDVVGGEQGGQQKQAPLENHILALRRNPKLAADFDKRYGAGSAAQYLQQAQ